MYIYINCVGGAKGLTQMQANFDWLEVQDTVIRVVVPALLAFVVFGWVIVFFRPSRRTTKRRRLR